MYYILPDSPVYNSYARQSAINYLNCNMQVVTPAAFNYCVFL